MRKIGIFGGTFNPVHIAHLAAAERAREELGLERVVFVPARLPPHKRGAQLAAGKDRLEMLRLAIASNPAFAVSDIELRRKGVSYTVQTVEAMRKKYPDAELYFLVGADMFLDLSNWREIRRLATLCKFVPVSRPLKAAGRKAHSGGAHGAGMRTLASAVGAEEARAIMARSVEMPLLEVSASELRRWIAEGKSVRYLLPDKVIAYIKKRRLYRCARDK